MKKVLLMLMIIAAYGMMLTSCGSGPSEQRKLAEKAMECLKNKDFKGYVDLVYFSESDSSDPEKLAQKKESMTQMLQGKIAMSEGQKDGWKGIKSYSYVSEQTDSTTSVVKMAYVNNEDKPDTMDIKLQLDEKGQWRIANKGK